MGSGTVPQNLNPILDEANPTSTGTLCSLERETYFWTFSRQLFKRLGSSFVKRRTNFVLLDKNSSGFVPAGFFIHIWPHQRQCTPEDCPRLQQNAICDFVLNNPTISFIIYEHLYTLPVYINSNSVLNSLAHLDICDFLWEPAGIRWLHSAATDVLQLSQSAYIGSLMLQLQV